MARFTGIEPDEQIPEKVKQLFTAVLSMIHEGVDLGSCKVVDITNRAGIGKGTAYEYFETREDIIVAAVVYSTRQITLWLEQELEKYPTFFEKVEFMFDIMEKKIGEAECLISFLHMLTDNSVCGKKLRDMGGWNVSEESSIQSLLKNVLVKGVENGDIRKDLPLEYMETILYSKLFIFLTYTQFKEKKEMPIDEMKKLILHGFKAEFSK